MAHILIADDEKNIREGLKRALSPLGHKITLSADGKEALYLFESQHVDLIIADIQMPRLSGFDMFKEIIKTERSIPIIFITGHGNIETAVEAMRMGAYDFLTKPLSLEKLELIIARALKVKSIEEKNRALVLKVQNFELSHTLLGSSKAMEHLRQTINLIAVGYGNIHIYGESGTGKELVCDALHQIYGQDKPLIKVNCAALSESVLESELFGHEKGAFTGADELKMGRFEAADGGMIFLDEISEISPQIQVKLLRVIQEKKIERVGSHRSIDVKIRIVSASNKDLREQVSANAFREDLFYRLNVLDIHIPPLRERRGDITLLAAHFFNKYLAEYRKENLKITPQVYSTFEQYKWPGNVRELMNTIEKMVALSQNSTLTVESIPETLRHALKSQSPPKILQIPIGSRSLKDIEQMIIDETIQFCNGNKSEAADLLGIGRKTLYRKTVND